MSFRSIFVRVKRVAAEVLLLRRGALPTGKGHAHVRPQDQQLVQNAAKSRQQLLTAQTSPFNPRLQGLVGFRVGYGNSVAAQLRRDAVRRLLQAAFGRGRGSLQQGGSGARFPIYAFVGLTLAAGERSLLEDNDAKNMNEKMWRLPLETCCEIVRDIFQSREADLNLQHPAQGDFPSDTSAYDISGQLLGKGTSASIYTARLRQLSPAEDEVSETLSSDENVSRDEVDSIQEEEEDWEMVSDDDEDEASVSLEDITLTEVSSDGLDDASDADEEADEEKEEMSSASRGHPSKEDADGSFDLALKMMFNYDIASNAVAITQAFERECLPLWPSLGNGSFGDVRWENGHRAKKKDRRFLPPHPNIVEIHHAFVAPTVAHDLDEARTLFPAALPTRLHIDGMGRNQTMFLVMKRYDMTLAEYNHVIGCPSQHVAMVIVAQLLEGVSHLVHHGIAHRDLKSNNILVELAGGSPRVVIADFGCCLADSSVGLRLPYPTKHTEKGGNSALMAPEVKLSRPGPDTTINYTKSDAWAVGAISYEVLGLSNPFYSQNDGRPGLDSGLYEDGDLPPLPDSTHPTLAKVVDLLLRKDPDVRPTAKVAANMLHLALWQQPAFTFASWEGSRLIPNTISLQQHLATWLLQLSAGLLCSRTPGGCQTTEIRGQALWLNSTEYRLCTTFMSSVTPSDLLAAANCLVP